MPTPFTHLQIANRILHDPALSPAVQAMIHADASSFLVGGIVADAKPTPTSERSTTHFYHYARPMPDNPWREMFRRYPELLTPESPAHQAFLAGYVAHLAADEYWSRYMLKPHFAESNWGADLHDRFFVLHLLLIHLDERDEFRLPDTISKTLRQTKPHHWLPFLPDPVICEWRDFIAEQLDGDSQTLAIFGSRVHVEPEEMRAMLDDTAYMQHRLWDNIQPEMLSDFEEEVYQFSREQVEVYFREFIDK